VDCGALDALVVSLEEFDPGVKEAAAWAISYIARHNAREFASKRVCFYIYFLQFINVPFAVYLHCLSAELSQAVVDAGVVPLLVLCIQEPEIALKRVAASALSDIAKHSPELAQTVVDTGAIAHLAQMILSPDAKLKVTQSLLKINVLKGEVCSNAIEKLFGVPQSSLPFF